MRALYLRMSLDRELGIERQREDGSALCERNGWEYVEYIDLDKSATRGPRPAYDRMCADIAAGKIDGIVTWKTDRLYRLMKDLLPLIDLCNNPFISIDCVTSGLLDLSTSAGRMVAKILAAVSEDEGETRTLRQTRALLQLAQSGGGKDKDGNLIGKAWGARAFGYSADHDNPAQIPSEARAIKQGYDALLAGSTLYGIAKAWNDAQVFTTHGNPWDGTTARKTLENPRYCGLRSYRKEVVGKGNWEPIVSVETWEAARLILAARTKSYQRRPSERNESNLLSGMLICGGCGLSLSAGARYSHGKKTLIYRCNHPMCSSVARSRETIDAWVRQLVIDKLNQGDWMPKQEARETGKILHAEATAIRSRMDNLGIEFADGGITAGQMRVATTRLEEKLADIEDGIRKLAQSRVFEGIIGKEDMAAVWDGMTQERQRALLRALCTITIHKLELNERRMDVGTKIDVEWLTPSEGDYPRDLTWRQRRRRSDMAGDHGA